MPRTHRRVHVLHGANVNALGRREPHLYGRTTLAALNRQLIRAGRRHGEDVRCRQTNHEGRLVDWIHESGRVAEGLILNAGAWTHTSVAVRDAVTSIRIPVIEVHCSNIFAREAFRRHSFIAPVVHGIICGFGTASYLLALEALGGLMATHRV